MRWQFAQPLICVHVHVVCGVDGQQLVGVDCDQNGACVCLETERFLMSHIRTLDEHKQAPSGGEQHLFTAVGLKSPF